MRYWSREEWLAAGTKAERRKTARFEPLAWILEYEPTILFPGKGYIPLRPYPFQQEFIRCRDQYRAINKPRQCGISTIAAAEVAWEFSNIPGSQIVIISKDKDAAINFHKYVYQILISVKDKDPNFPKLIKENERETTNSIGSRVVSLAAGAEAGRSFSVTHLILDEAAFQQYADDIWQASSPSLARTNGRATIISTPKGRANFFARIFEESDHLGFHVFNFGWWDVPDYNPYYNQMVAAKTKKEKEEWKDKARKSDWYKKNSQGKTDLQWKQEFEGVFDAHTGTVFSTRVLETAFVRNYLTEYEDERGLITEHWSSGYDPSHYYATGIDLGRKNDATVIITYDITDPDLAVLVDYKYIDAGYLEWNMLEMLIVEHLDYWKPMSIHDGTGSGDSISEGMSGLSDPFIFTKNTKPNMILRMQHAFASGRVKIPKIPRLFHEHKLYTWEDKGIVQDTVMANGLAILVFHDTSNCFVGVDQSIQFVNEGGEF